MTGYADDKNPDYLYWYKKCLIETVVTTWLLARIEGFRWTKQAQMEAEFLLCMSDLDGLIFGFPTESMGINGRYLQYSYCFKAAAGTSFSTAC